MAAALNNAEPKFPGFPNQGAQVSGRYMMQGQIRSTIGRNIAPGTLVGGNPMQVLSHNYDNTVQIFGERAEAPESN